MICECEFIATSVFKKLQPKPNYTAPYVRLPWNTHRGMIGQAVNIFKTGWGFAVVTDMHKFNEFKPLEFQSSDDKASSIEKDVEYQVQTEEEFRISKSGRSKPPSVLCGIQLSAIPGRIPDYPYALFWLAPAGIHRFTVSRRYVQRVACAGFPRFSPPKRGLCRFITDGGPCRFCVIAVTLATRTCMRLRIWPVGGLSSAAQDVPPSAALSLSHTLFGAENIYSYGCSARTLLQHPGLRTFYEGFRTDRASGYEIHLYIRSRVLPLALPWGGAKFISAGLAGQSGKTPCASWGMGAAPLRPAIPMPPHPISL